MKPADEHLLTAAGLLFEATEALKQQLSQVHESHGLRGSDFDALLRIERSPGSALRMIDLAAQTAMSTSGITRVVDRLEASGHVTRELDPDDRRSWIVRLTPSGRIILDADLVETVRVIKEELQQPLGANLDELTRHLRTVRDHIRPEATSGSEPPSA